MMMRLCYNNEKKGVVDMIHLENKIKELVENATISHLAIRIGAKDEIIYDTFRGNVDESTLFDMASVTKIIATTTLALIAIDRGLLALDDTIDKFFAINSSISIKNLLTHTIGIGHKSLNKQGYTYENIVQKILDIPLDLPIGKDVLYSCPGFILLGKILEKIFSSPLDECFARLVAKPLELNDTSFLPKDRQRSVNSNIEEAFRGMVNDYNCRFLGGIAGNAGLFSNLSDVTKYAKFLLNKGQPLISENTFTLAVKNHTQGMSCARGLGFLYVDDRYAQTGNLFEDGAIGHCGHTGQSLFVDYRSGLYVIILSDATVSTMKKYGAEKYEDVINMRAQLHSAIQKDLGESLSIKR